MGYGDMVIWVCLTVCPSESGKCHRENVDKPRFLGDKPMHFGWISPKIHQPGLTLTWLGSLLVEVVSARATLGAANLHRTVETTMGFQSPPNRCWLHKKSNQRNPEKFVDVDKKMSEWRLSSFEASDLANWYGNVLCLCVELIWSWLVRKATVSLQRKLFYSSIFHSFPIKHVQFPLPFFVYQMAYQRSFLGLNPSFRWDPFCWWNHLIF